MGRWLGMVPVGPVSSLGRQCGCAAGWDVQGGSRSHDLWTLEEARVQPLPGATGGNQPAHTPLSAPRGPLRPTEGMC